MTLLTLTHNHHFPFAAIFPRKVSLSSFIELNRKGFITILFLGIIGGAVAAYLAAIYWSFNLGVAIRDDNKILHTLAESYARKAVLLETHNVILSGEDVYSLNFEKISTIKYLNTERVTASLPFIRP